MAEIKQILDERLAEAGDTLPLSGHVDQEGYSLGEHEFSLPEGMDYDLVLTNVGEGILATGMVRAHVVGTCDRCLDPAEFDVDGEVDEYYLFKDPGTFPESDDEDEVDYSLVLPDHSIDLGEAINSALLMETPYVVLCREDCAGLCPVCGTNLNHEDCGHAAQLEALRMESNPFSVLKGLDLS
ncbi:YceD family protein [Olsenella phocaeensis]|uniref:YceD family protein n=1 Tax=Olsenella phocaeensis TaxID=1852385 RepID=UPI0009302974|nr:DUF177 domain-containing protein [Olsenella phocaeensis]